MTEWVFKQTEPSLWIVGFYEPDGSFEPESDHGSPDEAAARTHWLNGGCWTSEQDGSCPTAAETLDAVLNQVSDDEQCPACDAANDWANRSYCPYHHGGLNGHERAFGDLSQVAIAFQVDPELIGTVLQQRSEQRIHEYQLIERAEQEESEDLTEYEKELLNSFNEAARHNTQPEGKDE